MFCFRPILSQNLTSLIEDLKRLLYEESKNKQSLTLLQAAYNDQQPGCCWLCCRVVGVGANTEIRGSLSAGSSLTHFDVLFCLPHEIQN